jgi:glycosyltransferase involved in cell wall biosynthesis
MKDNKFLIIVSQYNAVEYIKKCLDSIVNQTYKNFECVVVDDNSFDGTWEIALDYPFHAIQYSERHCRGGLNTKEAIDLLPLDKEDIIVLVSGDDYLIDDSVMSYLNEVYQDENIYMTYGNFIPLSGNYSAFCKPIDDTRKYRHCGEWYASHIITFKKKLWDMVDDRDLRAPDGEYSHYGFDVSLLYPMIEMCGKKHLKFIDKVLYVYNDLNPTCVYRLCPKESLSEAEYFRNKPPYPELP